MIWGNTEKELATTPVVSEAEVQQPEHRLTVDVWELYPQLSSSERQEIGACGHLEGIAQENLETQLLLHTPDQGVISYQGNPTDGGGCAFFKLEPVNANNGETISYQVCFFICLKEVLSRFSLNYLEILFEDDKNVFGGY